MPGLRLPSCHIERLDAGPLQSGCKGGLRSVKSIPHLDLKGPENISARLQDWATKAGIGLIYIQPVKPQQNAYVECYNRTLRTEWLGGYHFNSIEEVQDHAIFRGR